MIIRISEIGVAVSDIAEVAQKLAFVFGAGKGKLIAAPEYNMTAQMIRVGNIEFELMESLAQKGLIDNFIRQRGQGLHHIAFQVDDIVQTISEMKQKGVKTLNDKPIQTHGMKAAFLHPDSFCGVLIELIEGSPRWIDDSPLPLELQLPLSIEGVGSEGLLSVGIMVEDITSAVKIYSNALSTSQVEPSTSNDIFLSESCNVRVGNVNLELISMQKKASGKNQFFEHTGPGLNHLVIKVGNLSYSAEFLKKHAINFVYHSIFSNGSMGVIVLNPKGFSGIPIFLKESSPEYIVDR
ncbi:MAG: VOC family protein [Bacteroidales bacterium]|nr:VOC family protein [Bacteroidales bacterium]